MITHMMNTASQFSIDHATWHHQMRQGTLHVAAPTAGGANSQAPRQMHDFVQRRAQIESSENMVTVGSAW